METLKVYRASAGSGKTFTLAVEYIKLVVENPFDYRHILAVTFTNKATNEMKERIISALNGIATKDEDYDSYLAKIKETCSLADDVIRQRCQKALSLILHDYNRFRIETIDSFFQSIIRDLAHELNLTANLKVDLNAKDVLHEAVQEIINELDEKSEVFAAILQFVREKIDEGHSWKVAGAIESFSRHIYDETYMQKQESLMKKTEDPDFFSSYKQALKTIKEEAINQVMEAGRKFMDRCAGASLGADDFRGKSRGIYSFFSRMTEGKIPDCTTATVQKTLNGEMPWMSDESEENTYAEGFRDILYEAVDISSSATHMITSANAILSHINEMMMLRCVNQKVRQLNDEANRFLLAETAHFLSRMISTDYVPFIYEKTGSRFKYIMIDEFQDTSTLQWHNFKPLINNSISENHRCLLVGDVKQSIYRFRNSDWKILGEIDDDHDYAGQIKVEDLRVNYRSKGNIITFNNKFFNNLRRALNTPENIALYKAYEGVSQEIREGNDGLGLVNVRILSEDSDTSIEEAVLERVKDLMVKGVALKDMAILTRDNKAIGRICDHFAMHAPGIPIVSSEAFKLEASQAVRLMIIALQAILHPDDAFFRHMLAFKLSSAMPEVGIDTDKALQPIASQCEMALPELCMAIYRALNLNCIKGEDAYLFFFFDKLGEYAKDQNADIAHFIDYWETTMHSVTIPSAAVDGIRILTIHKSKGLEFRTVIIPHCDWDFVQKHANIIWCTPDEAPYSNLPLTAVSCSKALKDSAFREDWKEESLSQLVDNVNLLYVAMTRPRNNMFIIAENREKKKKDSKKGTENEALSNVYQLLKLGLPEGSNEEFEFGTLCVDTEKKNEGENELTVCFEDRDSIAQFRQSNKSKDFIDNTDDTLEEDRRRYLNEGLLLHRLMELLRSPEDVDACIARMEINGELADAAYREDIRRMAKEALKKADIMEWFSPHWKVINECDILCRDNTGVVKTKRPDRVITDGKETIVIDYKTGREDDTHILQVRQYMELLSNMGYASPQGYIWYMRSGKITPVS